MQGDRVMKREGNLGKTQTYAENKGNQNDEELGQSNTTDVRGENDQ